MQLRTSQTRRGSLTPAALIALFVLMAAFAVAIDYSFLSETRIEMHNTTDSAALAGAALFVDDYMLLPTSSGAVELIAASRAEVIRYGEFNRVAGSPLVFDPNDFNYSNGDIVFGFIDRASDKSFAQAENVTDPTNTFLTTINGVRITGQRTRARGNPAGTLASRAFGLSSVDMRTTTTVMLDHDVIGFRPVTAQPLPLAPIALLSDPTGVNPLSWEFNVALRQGADVFRYDRTTRTIVPDVNGDGLHEITVQLELPTVANPNANGCVLQVGASSGVQVAGQVQNGVTPAELQSFGNPFVLDATNNLTVPGAPTGPEPGTGDYLAMETAFLNLRDSATQRVFPLYSSCDPNTNTAILSGFVAARVVSVQPMTIGQPLTFTLQPTVIAVPAAVTDATRRGAGGIAITTPYVVKVRIVE